MTHYIILRNALKATAVKENSLFSSEGAQANLNCFNKYFFISFFLMSNFFQVVVKEDTQKISGFLIGRRGFFLEVHSGFLGSTPPPFMVLPLNPHLF